MATYLNSTKFDNIYLNSDLITKAYLNNVKVFDFEEILRITKKNNIVPNLKNYVIKWTKCWCLK